MQKKIAVILGDGIGPEVTQQSIKVLNTIAKYYSHEFRYQNALMGACAIGSADAAIKLLSGCYLLFCHQVNHSVNLFCGNLFHVSSSDQFVSSPSDQ
jgi:uncharacterized membrane protein